MNAPETQEPTAESVVRGQFEESGLHPSLVPIYTAAVLALRDLESAAKLRQAGFAEAAAHLEPDPAVIAAAFGPQ